MKLSIAVLSLTLAQVVLAGEWRFDGGVCRGGEDGTFEIETAGGKFTLGAYFVKMGWRWEKVPDAVRNVSVEKGAVVVKITGTSPAGAVYQDNLPMIVALRGNRGEGVSGKVSLGGKVADLDKKMVYGWGGRVDADWLKFAVEFSEPRSQSFWGGGSRWQVRVNLKGNPAADGSVAYEETLVLRGTDGTFPKIQPPSRKQMAEHRKSTIAEQKRVQYARILNPPQEAGFDAARWLALLKDDAKAIGGYDALEDLLDAKSRLYSLADRLRHRPDGDAAAEKLVKDAYAALNRLDYPAATNAISRLDASLVGSEKWMPLTAYSPFSWIKSFTQWGYVKHPDGVGVYEPDPWNLQWQDGFRMSLAQDARVSVKVNSSEPFHRRTCYNAPMTDVHTERDWVSTRWILPDRTITFSVLTPVIDVDGVDTLTLSGFPVPPNRLHYVDPAGRSGIVRLTADEPDVAEVIPSVLMDFKAPPPKGAPPSVGEQAIDPAQVDRPWLRLHSRCGNWSVALFPGARPVSAKWENGVFTLKLERKSYVGVLRLRDNLHSQEQQEVMEFFARVAAAYPVRCHEKVSGATTEWRYVHRVRENAFGTRPHVIAPVPPLVDYADIPVAGSRKFKYPTKWGVLRYADGDVVSCTLPERMRLSGRPLLGVNVGLFGKNAGEINEAGLEDAVTNGAKAVRLNFGAGKTHPTEEALELLERVLAKYGKRGVRFLLDPHGREYSVQWSTGISPDPDVEGRYLSLWEKVSAIGGRHPDAVQGYDLYNEPGCIAGSEGRWKELNERVGAIIRRNHPGAHIFYPGVYGGNPNGLFNLTPLEIEGPQTVTWHFYTPHSFTHQKCQTHNRGGDTCVFYPSWAPPIDWKAGIHFGGDTVSFFDKWTLAASMLPAFEHRAEFGVPLHCGEFSVIGYANRKSPFSAFVWTRDVIELLGHDGEAWHLWNMGFGLSNRYVREYVHGLWRGR